ncbi:MAG: thioredoxin family protein [Xanthobacteraceae bacterium]|nr:thioredoxin family protein [Xanthobacteraceae bacterium]
MRRFLTATLALVAMAYSTIAFADFVTFEKNKFETLVKSNAPVVVHTHEWWCSTCRAQAKVLEELQKDSKFAKVAMLRASASGDSAVLAPMKVTSRSIILVFAGGKEIGRLDWVTDAAQIRALLEKAVAQAGG